MNFKYESISTQISFYNGWHFCLQRFVEVGNIAAAPTIDLAAPTIDLDLFVFVCVCVWGGGGGGGGGGWNDKMDHIYHKPTWFIHNIKFRLHRYPTVLGQSSFLVFTHFLQISVRSMISNHSYAPDDVIQNGRQDLEKSRHTSRTNYSSNWYAKY